jgi:hypothetical protein
MPSRQEAASQGGSNVFLESLEHQHQTISLLLTTTCLISAPRLLKLKSPMADPSSWFNLRMSKYQVFIQFSVLDWLFRDCTLIFESQEAMSPNIYEDIYEKMESDFELLGIRLDMLFLQAQLLEASHLQNILPMSRSSSETLESWFHLSTTMPVSHFLKVILSRNAVNLLYTGNQGLFAPGEVVLGTTEGDVDIYGHDSYPLGFDCANPSVWPAGNIPTYFHASHVQQSPSSPFAIPEFQGGAFDPWGGNVCSSESSY